MNRRSFVAGVVLPALAWVASAADATGKWTSEQPGRDGGPSVVSTYDLKANGSKLTGTITPGGAHPRPLNIINGKVDGDRVSFEAEYENGGATILLRYDFIVSADRMTGTRTNSPNGRVIDVTCKRVK